MSGSQRAIRMMCVATVLAVAPVSWAQSGGDAEPFTVKPMFREPMLLGAHRGGAKLFPEGTLFAYTECARLWPTMLLEADARVTTDGHAVLLHDEMVDRTTDGTGPVASMTLEEVKRLDAGYQFTRDGGQTYPYRGKGLTVATLKEVLDAFPKARFLVEFKDDGVEQIIQAIREAKALDRVIVASFDPARMNRARALAPSIATCFDFDSGLKMLGSLSGGTWDSYQPTDDMLSLSRDMLARFGITPEMLATVKGKGIVTQIHTVNNPDEMRRMIAFGFDSILSDAPDVLAQVVEDMGKSPDPKN